MSARCGDCRWFDGDVWLDDDGHGKGECCIDPPAWIGPRDTLEWNGTDFWFEWLEDGWKRPMVGVASKPCRRFEEAGA